MALTVLLTFIAGLLYLLAGVCDADTVDDDLLNLESFIYTNRYPVAKPYDSRVIVTLAAKGECMSYIGLDEAPLESLASCELHCWGTGYYNTWDCIAPVIDESRPDWNNTFTDESLLIWTPGNCSCSNSTSPTPSVQGGDDYLSASTPDEVSIKVATRVVRDLTTYGYRITPGFNGFLDPQMFWDFWTIDWVHPSGEFMRIGVFGIMNNGYNNGVLRVHEIWAGRDTRANGVRAAFHDDVINFWRLTPLFRNLNMLTEIRFDTVIEDGLNNLAPWVYAVMGNDHDQGLLVQNGGMRVNEQHAFRTILSRCRFAMRMQQAINEYVEFAHRRIMAFYFTRGRRDSGFDFAIYFDGYNPASVGDITWDW
ncbi:hypothetical protein UCDDA912_g08679 [Diaporthe ampelina]|uniref:Uncharacterized protein n=1 Tax=Diaporthe ampelina TaxID=1214573 RepID=A0A0G2HTB3_9PEZI|nr:hypothetical protein UCDDA912_g08679 [Diaporthe ampelina]